jgi:hypothetical protein
MVMPNSMRRLVLTHVRIRLISLAGAVLLAGCKSIGSHDAVSTSTEEIVITGDAPGSEASGSSICGPTSCSPTTSASPCRPAESRAPSVFHVHVPQQRVVVQDKYACPENKAGTPAGAKVTSGDVQAASQEVILVPRTVLVPFVATSATGPLRMVAPAGVMAGADEAAADRSKAGEKTKAGAPVAPAPLSADVQQPCATTTVIEIQRVNERIDVLHRLIDRLCDKLSQ